jgi:colanic acid biosynthesis glycosyl transferase WcaI
MRVLYLSQNFPPETVACQARAHDMAHHLVLAGHQVTVLTEIPNHPSGIIPPEYRGKFWQRSMVDGIDVIRVWVKASPQKTFGTRMALYLSYMANAVLAGLVKARGRYDVIYATSPTLFVGGAALALSILRRTPMVFEVRDLWPESAVALGELSNPRAIAMASKLEEICYHRAGRVVVVTEGIRQRLEERGYGSKLVLIPNGANTQMFYPDREAGAATRAELGLEGKFLVLYAGIHGIAQGLETALEAAAQLSDTPDVHLVFVGDGPKKAELLALRDRLGLENVTMLPERPRATMPHLLSAADMALVPLKRIELFQRALPSKMFDAWACGCPVLLSIDGEARQVLAQAKGGVFVQPENANQMAQAIRTLRGTPDLLRSYGDNGRHFVEERYSRHRLATQLEELLLEVISGTCPTGSDQPVHRTGA